MALPPEYNSKCGYFVELMCKKKVKTNYMYVTIFWPSVDTKIKS
jgi:hypothetical protein